MSNPYEKCIQRIENLSIKQVSEKIATCKEAETYLKKLSSMPPADYPALRNTLDRIKQLYEKLEHLERIPACEKCKKHGTLSPSNIHDLKEAVYQCYECVKKQSKENERNYAEKLYKKLHQEVLKRIGKLKESVRHCLKCHRDSFLFVLKLIQNQCNMQSYNQYKNHPLKTFKDLQACIESMIYSCELMIKYTSHGNAQLLKQMKSYLTDMTFIITPVPRSSQNYTDVYTQLSKLTTTTIRSI
jgi:hypothetical protein